MTEISEAEAKINATAERLGLSMTAEFVPWSKSRNKDEKQPSLNWRVTIRKSTGENRQTRTEGVPILTTDYMAGSGHCPSYKQGDRSIDRMDAIKHECETGRAVKWWNGGPQLHAGSSGPILPKLADVLYSLVSDADAIDHPTYEPWAGDLGYDPDSRKGEAIYRACLEVGLKLRAALGEDGLRQLREACEGY